MKQEAGIAPSTSVDIAELVYYGAGTKYFLGRVRC
jgi:hypothetical protein